MDQLERATRRLAEEFGEKWNELNPGTNGAGFMFWDDFDHCIYADFFGVSGRDIKARIASALITSNEDLDIRYSLRIGFHETEEVASKTMMEWFGAEDPQGNERDKADS
jgi:hypothetical protein